MRLERQEKILIRLKTINDLAKKCESRINTSKLNYKAWQNKNNNLSWYYSEKDMLDDILRYENLYIYLEKKFNYNRDKL